MTHSVLFQQCSFSYSTSTARIVVQKCSRCTLQVDPVKDEWVSIGSGYIAFIAFFKGATTQTIDKIGE